jgi:glutaredoxin
MDLTVYSASWCRDCREAKKFLAKHNIPFREIDIENTPGAADEVLANVGPIAPDAASSTLRWPHFSTSSIRRR